jgi:Tfp pilus assembly protein PilX
MKHKHQANLGQDQRGFASLVIGLILVVVMALMTTGFAQLSRHEQQQALSNQLAIQANYAAETGINDAFNAIKKQTLITGDGSTCVDPAKFFSTGSTTTTTPLNVIDSSTGAQYTCVKVTFNSPTLVYDISTDQGKSVVTGVSTSPHNITVSWSSNDGHVAVPASGTLFYKITNWMNASGQGYPAVIQFDITPLKDSADGSLVDRTSLITNTRSYYLYPLVVPLILKPHQAASSQEHAQEVNARLQSRYQPLTINSYFIWSLCMTKVESRYLRLLQV